MGMDTFPVHLQKATSDGDGKKHYPLYLFHDGSGLCNAYARLAKQQRRDVYGVYALDFAHVDAGIASMEQLAALYIREADLPRKHDDGTPIVLGGWSFGGVLAFEVSRRLRAAGVSVAGVVLLDSPHPVAHRPLPGAVVARACGAMPAHTPALRAVRAAIGAQFGRNAGLLAAYAPKPSSQTGDEGGDVRCVMLKCKGAFDAEALCGVEYPWLSDEACRTESVRVWEGLVGGAVPVLEVRGNHFDLFAPENVEDVSAQLEKAVRMLEVDG